MRRLAAASMLILLMVVPVLIYAQNDCGDGLPCGRIPWDLPALPVLPSPTVMPTFAITIVPTGGSATATPVPTSTVAPLNPVNVEGIEDSISTLQSVINSTPFSVNDLQGTPVDTETVFSELAENAGEFFGYTRSLSNAQFGSISPLILLTGFSFLTVASVKTLTIALPFIATLVGFIRKLVIVVLEFIPF